MIICCCCCCYCSLTQSCLTLCDPIDCITLGLPISNRLLKFFQVHVNCMSEGIQPSHPLSLFLLLPSIIPNIEDFLISQLFASDDQNTGVSASAPVLPVNIQGWCPLRLPGLISLLSNALSGVFSCTTVQRHQFFGILPSLWSSFHNYMWPLGRPLPWLYGPLSAE